ncbi:ribonucleotide-diphosphate reductase subunit beta [Bradyrhizobium elkanii]|uniref:ribonucleoside-diphosphate reductase n=1 Tax=Bradyrhizobium elkanii TaxID=29448 RepID=A0ABV4EZV4_BRAEL|nr:ribonucleotide-diphosphate reductase subunit beta [Bradyrhizobium elkanii]MCP1757723.1 ribonucleoside-diphosphate reductase beta chain [Bradyrhizobium elkanii]MCS3881980.1 ribonucleoside-diphosphate reductase beta chain [Bradyrhizobium elkanii]MCS4218740.1 ribonucleoside-diphosphate reductase beta chain [Bradyrhizobium elkanii]MCW2109952.1 ribonucleoside-diphosphate reductase beta chain [Bradyrhizobium elkanii]MCW2201674.1 ribonucleoside-diphosphate reductase beta chain [Bradyrhizobium elka
MLFEEQIARKPNLYPWTQEFIDRIWAGFWTPNEFDFKADYGQFKTELTDQERQVIVRTLSAIGQVEIAVKRFWAQLGNNFPHPSMSDLGYWMAATEVTHNLAYEKLLETLRLGDVFEQNLKEPVVRNRVDYLRKYLDRVYTDDKKQFVYAIILFTLFVENVSLFSQFYVVLWFNRFKNVLKDTAQQVQYTRNEEMLHAQVGIKLIHTLREEYPELFDADLEARVLEESKVAYQAEKDLITWMIGDYSDSKISAEILHGFVQNRLNDSLHAIGFAVPFVVDKSIAETTRWMDEESYGNNIVDFFHKRPVDYAKKNRVYTTEDLF